MMNRVEMYYEPHPAQLLRRSHNNTLMLPPPPLVTDTGGGARVGTWSGYSVPFAKQRVSECFVALALSLEQLVHKSVKFLAKIKADV